VTNSVTAVTNSVTAPAAPAVAAGMIAGAARLNVPPLAKREDDEADNNNDRRDPEDGAEVHR
jgi:hypothetical protein